MDTVLQESLHQLPLLAILLVLSGLFSGSETAFFSLQVSDLSEIRKRNSLSSKALLALHEDLSGFLMTVLMCNMVVNILFFANSTMVGRTLGQHYGQGWEFFFGVIALITIIILGEITPKTIAAGAQRHVALFTALPLYLLHKIFSPLRLLLGGVVLAGERALNLKHIEKSAEEELELLLNTSRTDGIITRHEHLLLSGVLDLPQVKVQEVMTPRIDAICAENNDTIADVLQIARKHGHAKLPVRDSNTDEFTGWIDVRHLLAYPETGTIQPHVRSALVVSEFDRADQVLKKFLEHNIRIAIVVDERGSSAGLLTQSDILAEIVGDIGDEDDMPKQEIITEADGSSLISGSMSLREWRTMFDIPADSLPKVATLSGLITTILGRTGRIGDTVDIDKLNLEIKVMRHKRIHSVYQTIKPEGTE